MDCVSHSFHLISLCLVAVKRQQDAVQLGEHRRGRISWPTKRRTRIGQEPFDVPAKPLADGSRYVVRNLGDVRQAGSYSLATHPTVSPAIDGVESVEPSRTSRADRMKLVRRSGSSKTRHAHISRRGQCAPGWSRSQSAGIQVLTARAQMRSSGFPITSIAILRNSLIESDRRHSGDPSVAAPAFPKGSSAVLSGMF